MLGHSPCCRMDYDAHLSHYAPPADALPGSKVDTKSVRAAMASLDEAGAAVGETGIVLTPRSPSLLKRLLKGEWGAAE